jgi:hypothetical protein
MPMIWLYVFLLDFLIPFLCDPDLQCVQYLFRRTPVEKAEKKDRHRIGVDPPVSMYHPFISSSMVSTKNDHSGTTTFLLD